MKKIITLFIIWFLLLNLINKLSSRFFLDNTNYELPKNIKISHRFLILPWLNFDGRNYLEIVNKGYKSLGQKVDLWAFFPFYPLLIRILSFNLFLNPIFIGLGISLICFIASLYLFNILLIQDRLSLDKRKKMIILLMIFPTSFYFAAYYTESLFLLLVLSAFYFLNQKKIIQASIFTALASATRIVGLAIVPSILWEAYRQYKETKKFPLSVLIAPLGYVFFSLYAQVTTGSAFSMIEKHRSWGRQIQPLGIWFALRDGLLKILFRSNASKNNLIVYSVELLEFFIALSLILIIIFSLKKIKLSYWFYILFSSLFIFSSGILGSIPRFIIVMFPIFIYLVKVLPKRIYYSVVFFCFILLIYLTSLFLRGYWVA